MISNVFSTNFLSIKFDESQMKSILSLNQNTLINAGAGSGKTTTIIGRMIYLIADLDVSYDDIIVIVFNKAVAIEIREKLKAISNQISKNKLLLQKYPNLDIKIKKLASDKFGQKHIHTFHSYAHYIINRYGGNNYNLSDLAPRRPKELKPIIRKLITNKKINNLIRSYFVSKIEIKNIFKDINTLDEYNEYIKPKKVTLNGEKVKSLEELEIANHLCLKGINYKYEDRYPDSTVKYHPDFHIIKYDENDNLIYDLYLEHFAFDKNLKPPPFFKDKEKYIKNFHIKKNKMKEDGNDLISTFSYEFYDETIFDKIDNELNNRNIKADKKDIDDVINNFQKNTQTSYLQENLISALSIFKLNELTLDNVILKNKEIALGSQNLKQNFLTKIVVNLLSFLKSSFYVNDQSRINLAFIEVFSFFYNEYEKLIKKNYNKSEIGIDFDDQIIIGKKILKNTYNEKFRHIIVDEFQDISKPRAEIIRTLAKKNNSNSFFIGDDWQSINGFSGSDLNIMNNDFSKYFGPKNTIPLKYTFRFNDKVCNITKVFMETDENLQKKNLVSFRGANKNDKFNNLWNNQIPFHFIYNQTNQDLVEGQKIEHTELGIGLIKKNSKDVYYVLFKNSDKLVEINKNSRDFHPLLNEELLIYDDIINKLLKYENQNKEILFLTRLNISTYKYGNIKKNIVDPICKKFACKIYEDNGNIILRSKQFKKITFMTVHKSKGLEADYVFILNVSGDKQGFPLKRNQDEILTPFIKCTNLNFNSIDEERRLFYVAITRSKNKTFIYTDKNNSFVNEITENNKDLINSFFSKKVIKSIKVLKKDNNIDIIKKEKKLKTPYHAKMEIIKKNHPQAYAPWTKEEEIKLINFYKSKKNVKQISLLMKRQPGGIRSRLKKLNIIY